jgi:predicted site-specific integrase-resolvase
VTITESLVVVREPTVAKLLGVSIAALRRWRREGRGPAFVRLERCVGYQMADLQSFLAGNRVPPGSQQKEEDPL